MNRVLLPMVAMLAGCAAAPGDGPSQVALLVRDQVVQPNPDVTIERFGSVCWFNSLGAKRAIRVEVQRPLGASEDCATRFGFEGQDGKAVVEQIAPTQAAVLCFHETGEFSYTVTGATRPLVGTIRVVPQ